MKTILITGASKGLGFALVKEYLSKGWKVAGLDLNLSEELIEIKKNSNGKLEIFKGNVTDTIAIATIMEQLKDIFGHLDGIINNAGIVTVQSYNWTIERIEENLVRRDFEINTLGPMRILKYAFPLFLKSKAKQPFICNISSEAGSIGENNDRTGMYDYCISKVGVNMVTKLLSNDLKKRFPQARIMSIHPGWMQTDMGGPDAIDKPLDVARRIADGFANNTFPQDELFCDTFGKKLEW